MGRGRAKAKQVKVARRLKYNSGNTDLDRLKSELGVGESRDKSYDDLAEKYADYADDYGTEDRRDGTSG